MYQFTVVLIGLSLLNCCSSTPVPSSPVLPICPPFNPPIGRFNIAEYVGTWYEIARTRDVFETGLDCVNATYSLKKDGSMTILNEGYNLKAKIHAKQKGVALKTSQSNLFLVDIYPLFPKAPYYIADTALIEAGASVVISCVNTPLLPLRVGYILSRKRIVDDVEKTLLASILVGYGFDRKSIRFTEQAKCPE